MKTNHGLNLYNRLVHHDEETKLQTVDLIETLPSNLLKLVITLLFLRLVADEISLVQKAIFWLLL